MFPLEIWNNEATTNNQTERWFRSFTADQPGIQTAGKSFLGLRREDWLNFFSKSPNTRPALIRSQLNRQEFYREI